MKKIFATVLMLCFAGALSAQSITRAGFYMDNGEVVYANPKVSVTVGIAVEKIHFVPGEFARYAQKMLGVRASLTEKVETKVVWAKIFAAEPTEPCVKSCVGGAEAAVLPSFRGDSRAMSVEQQAQAAADMIFNMRRVRRELIVGDAGENVFGAGLRAALEEINAMEQQCLDMFYGTTVTTVTEHRYTITPTADEKNYIVCRYRDGEGVLPVSNLSGDPVILTFNPAEVSVSSLPIAGEKDKVKQEFIIAADCGIELLLGTESLAEGRAMIYQYGKRVMLTIK